MTAINFPDSPSNGDTHVVGGVTYTYDSTETKWKTTINSNAFLPLTGGTVSGNIVLGGEIQHDGDTDTNISFDADTIKFDTAGSERFRVDSSGRLGIGTTSPATTFVVDKSDASGLSAHILINNSESSSGLSLIGAGSSFSSGGWPSLTDCGIIRSSANSSNGVAIQAPVGAISFWNSSEAARIDSSGNFNFNSGYGSVATAYGVRAWVNFNGEGAVAIRASGNVSSITDNGTGYYTVNFTNNMPDANYGVVTGLGDISNNADAGFVQAPFAGAPSTGAFRFRTVNTNYTTATDCEYVYLAFIR